MESPASSAVLSSATTVRTDPAKKAGKRAAAARSVEAANDCGSDTELYGKRGKKNTTLLERIVACNHFTDKEKREVALALLRGF